MKLEVYAARIFTEYCRRQGLDGQWDYLAPKRKMVWIEEARFLLKSAIEELKKELKPPVRNLGQASYEIGYNSGMNAEKMATQELIKQTLDDLEAQYLELKENYNK